MQRWRGVEAAPPDWGRCVVTIGVFDGVHRGHQIIVGRTVELAATVGLPSVVVTFDPHPSEVVRPGSHPPVLTGPACKADLLGELGVDVLCVLAFTREFSRLSPEAFVHAVLVENLHAATVVVGENFRFGHKAAGDIALLTRLGSAFGFLTDAVAMVNDGQTRFSSTSIRACIAAGDMACATNGLGREHRIEGVVVRGDGRGRSLGFPTANVETPPYAAVPADGVYAGWLVRAGQRWPAAISIGTNPTFSGRERRVEAYLLDFDADLYGEHVGLDFTARLRGTLRFAGPEDLVTQMGRDVTAVRGLLQV
ncbi:MAG: bifunctional riboflavin kinase/FAD synthetase [Mycobacteriales bacterium]